MTAEGPAPGLIVAAPASGSGKTVITLGLLRALRNRGIAVAAAKTGPDYIDTRFHAAACGQASVNLDPWAMRRETVAHLLHRACAGAGLLIVEGVMGLFDGAAGGAGSTADLAALTGLPVVLVVDVRGQAQSAAAVVDGFRRFRGDVRIAGVIANRVAGQRHLDLVAEAMAATGVPLLGGVPRAADLDLPSRHLGLVQAVEHPDLEGFLDRAAAVVAACIDLDRLAALAGAASLARMGPVPGLPPAGQRIALACDAAFAFTYDHLLAGWRHAGAEVLPFSPLADEAPPGDADAVFLPGGYPELHAGRLSANERFLGGLRAAAARGCFIYGECGGYMTLGQGLVDAAGRRHRMAGLLAVETSFAERRLSLGYRQVRLAAPTPLGAEGVTFRGHEFHFATILDEGAGSPLFTAAGADGTDLGTAGRCRGRVAGSFIHLLDRCPPPG